MPSTRSLLPTGSAPRLALLLLLVAAFAYACSDGGSPTSPATPAPGAAGATVGTNVAIEGAHIDIEKATNGVDADTPTGPEITVGDPVTWTYVVTNTGTADLNAIAVTDDKLGAISCPATTLASEASTTCEAQGIATEGQYANLATVVAFGLETEVSDEDPSHYLGVPEADGPEIDIEKATNGFDADTPTGPEITVGDPITWTYVVTNTGTADLRAITVTDDKLGAISCPATTLVVGASMTCEATGVAIEGQYANLATVVGTGLEIRVTDEDPSHYLGVPEGEEDVPAIDIEKATNGVDADTPTGPVVNVGDPITWTYLVTNTGDVDLRAIAVTDDQIGAITCPATTLAVGASMTCTATGFAVEGQYANLATVVGTGLEIQVTDEDPSHYFGLVETPGFLGCSQGYWKNHQSEWADTPYAASDLVGDVFSSAQAYPATAASTLDQALDFSGGPTVEDAARNLLKQAVAALLNASHPDVSSPYTVAEVIDMVNAAIDSADRQTILSLKDDLDRANNLGCPLN